MPRQALRTFVQGVHRALQPGALLVFMDNRFVPGSSTPISQVDAQGNSWQRRVLVDGRVHFVMKNFPDEAEVRAVLADLSWHAWPHFWAVSYRIA